MIRSRSPQQKKFLRFERKDKIRLITAVKNKRLLWDMTDCDHNDLLGVRAAWQAVSAEIGREPEECKIAWRSLRQSYRYHCKIAYNRFKVGDADDKDEADPLETPDIQWEFANYMLFLQEMSKKQKNSDSAHLEETATTDSLLEDSNEYTDTEYLENTYDIHDGDEDFDDTVDNGVDDDDKNMFHLSKSSKNVYEIKPPKNDVCRTCTQAVNARTAQNLFKPENQKLLQEIKELTDLLLKRNDDLSDFICDQCQQNLEIATEFRRVCIEAQTETLIKIQVKAETDIPTYREPNIQRSSSSTSLCIEEERLEDMYFSDNEDYYKEAENVQQLPSTPTPASPTPRAKKKLLNKAKTGKYKCHQCGLTFATPDLRKMHMHESHDMQLQTRFVCKHCGIDFKYSDPLVEHLKSIGVHFGYKCEECSQKFHSRHFLKKHQRSIHGKADEHICHICGKNFTNGFNLRNHIVRHAGTRPHKCKLCSGAFPTAAELNNHKRTHDKVRPYPCRYACGKSFRHCSNRSTHERVHMEGSLRPFQCEYCDKTFVTQGDCRTHQRNHTMSRNFSCNVCEQSFKLQKHYYQHLNSKSHKKIAANNAANSSRDSTAQI